MANDDLTIIPSCGDPVVDLVVMDLHIRSKQGQEKYGQTLARDDLAIDDWLTHAYQEALDFALYIKRIQLKLAQERAEKVNA